MNEEMDREWGNGERMRKWREIHSLHFFIFSLFPPSLSISCIKNCLILSQNLKYSTFVANVTKKLNIYMHYEEIILGQIHSASCAGLHLYKLNEFWLEVYFQRFFRPNYAAAKFWQKMIRLFSISPQNQSWSWKDVFSFSSAAAGILSPPKPLDLENNPASIFTKLY